ncbi:hydroxymethylglutaryl-CoA synthase [Leucobacter luti]|uniref:hydroxymethylglutaryl-CoA synthase n=1 Tax=Leucobacter luti TaxID=340320 RepID=UPI003D07A00E
MPRGASERGISVGIHDLEVATSHFVVSLSELAEHNGTDPAKYLIGLGQREMSFPAPDEDAVTIGAEAAAELLARTGVEGITTLLFATESGIDQSKAAGLWVHRLLGLPASMRVAEVKQACYGGTAALQAAAGMVARAPQERVLVIASDVARYALDSPGEPTQGAGAVAMLVSAAPALVELDPVSGRFTAEVDDFWRPNGMLEALVDGELSVAAYLDGVESSWLDLAARGGPSVERLAAILFHQPFGKMAQKGLRRLSSVVGRDLDGAGNTAGEAINSRMGNSYAASVYAALAGLLEYGLGEEPLSTGDRIGWFSYGSGSVSEFLTGTVGPAATTRSGSGGIAAKLDARAALGVPEYRALHTARGETPEVTDRLLPRTTRGRFRLAEVRGGARRYEGV